MIYYVLYVAKIQNYIPKKSLIIPKHLNMLLLLDGFKLGNSFIYNLLLKPSREYLITLIILVYLISTFLLVNINKHISS